MITTIKTFTMEEINKISREVYQELLDTEEYTLEDQLNIQLFLLIFETVILKETLK